jgi:hypothetical protein
MWVRTVPSEMPSCRAIWPFVRPAATRLGPVVRPEHVARHVGVVDVAELVVLLIQRGLPLLDVQPHEEDGVGAEQLGQRDEDRSGQRLTVGGVVGRVHDPQHRTQLRIADRHARHRPSHRTR